jgi:hypothetical protein
MQYSLYFKPSSIPDTAGALRLDINGVTGRGYLVLPSKSYLLDPEETKTKMLQLLKSNVTFFMPDDISMLSTEELDTVLSPYELLKSFEASSRDEVIDHVLTTVVDFPKLIPELFL